MNILSFVILLVVIALFVLAFRAYRKESKKGCGCGCSGCSYTGHCTKGGNK